MSSISPVLPQGKRSPQAQTCTAGSSPMNMMVRKIPNDVTEICDVFCKDYIFIIKDCNVRLLDSTAAESQNWYPMTSGVAPAPA